MLLVKDASDPHPFHLKDLPENRFDFLGLNAVSPDFDHFIDPSGNADRPVRTNHTDIPGPDIAVQMNLFREIRQAEIASEIRCPITEISLFADWENVSLVVHDAGFRFLLPHPADWRNVIFPVDQECRNVESGLRLAVTAEDFHLIAENPFLPSPLPQ